MTDTQGKAHDPTTNTTGGVAYGTIDMRSGKKWPAAEAQIREITKQHGDVMMWMFDFVCTPNQIPTAQEYAAQALNLIVELCPDLKITRIVIGVTIKDEWRPAKQIMMGIAAKLSAPDIMSTIDFSTERTYLWVGGQLQS